jgi:hypothetical protein
LTPESHDGGAIFVVADGSRHTAFKYGKRIHGRAVARMPLELVVGGALDRVTRVADVCAVVVTMTSRVPTISSCACL